MKDWRRLIGIRPVHVFMDYARSLGYTVKIVGDYAYKKSRRYDSPTIRLKDVSLREDRMAVLFVNRKKREFKYRTKRLCFSQLAARFGHRKETQ
jgi:hypothetical protein